MLGLWAVGALLEEGRCAGTPPKLVADFETKTAYRVGVISGVPDGVPAGEPKASVTPLMASQGRKSLCFEYDGKEGDRASVIFDVKGGADGCDAIAFDIYAKHLNGGSFVVSIRQATEGEGKSARYKAILNMAQWVDGWTPVRLVKDAQLIFRQQGGVPPDWGKIYTVSFSVVGDMRGKVVYYIDNIRFENVSPGGKTSPNLLYNSSFEVVTNPGVPDGWSREMAYPPYGRDAWGTDTSTAFHGKKSVRIGFKGLSAFSWRRHTNILPGRDYTASVYLKANREGTAAQLDAYGVGRKGITITTDWQRYWLTGKAKKGVTVLWVRLDSDAVLWMDAAQFESGSAPTPYVPSAADAARPDEKITKPAVPAGVDASKFNPPTVRISRAMTPPRIDGDLTDACWAKAAEMMPFVKLEKDEPARRKTVARMCYDQDAFYFAARAEEPDMKAVTDLLRKDGGNALLTDAIEIFIDLDHDRGDFYQFVANVEGARFQARYAAKKLFAGHPATWHAEWTARGKTDATGWTLEAIIPLSCFDLRPPMTIAKKIGINITREDPRNIEHSSWAFSAGSFRLPEAFGTASGVRIDPGPYRFEVSAPAWQRGIAHASIRNHTGKDQPLEVAFVAEGPGDIVHTASARAESRAGADTSVSAALPLAADGVYRLFLRASDRTDITRALSQPSSVRISGTAILDLAGTELDFYTTESEARARCFIEAGTERCKNFKLRWWLECEGRQATTPSELQTRPGINEWPVLISGLENGAYVLKAALEENGNTIAEKERRFRKLPPVEHDVRINQWGRFLVCDGQPFLWYGFFDGIWKTDGPRYAAALDEMKSVRSTAVVNYVGANKRFERVGYALDQAHARGMKLWIHLGWTLSWWIPKYEAYGDRCHNETEANALLAEVVTKHKNHPALLGWCSLDEPGNRPTMFTKEYCEKYYKMIKKLDPHHPCIYSHLTHMGENEIYGVSTDMVLMPLMDTVRHERLFWEFWDAGFAMAVTAPCYGALGDKIREPTPGEQRSRMYKSIILGARGLCSYPFRCSSENTWKEFGRVGRELETLAPILLTPDDRLRVEVTPMGGKVFALLKAYRGKFYLITANMEDNAVEATFRLLDVPRIGKVTPMFDTRAPGRVEAESSRLNVRMTARGTAIYEIEPL